MKRQREKMMQNVRLFSFQPEYSRLKIFETILMKHFEKVYKYIKKRLKKKVKEFKIYTQSDVIVL